MNYTTYSSRVPNSQESIGPAFSVDVGTAPASIGQIPDSVSFDEINDGATPNLSGRVAPDTDGMRSKLLSSGWPFRIFIEIQGFQGFFKVFF